MLCQITFKIEANLNPDENLYLCGNLKELGNWDIKKCVQLTIENENNDKFWINKSVLELKERTKIEFKCVIINNNNNTSHWESLPNNLNRKYKAKYYKVILKGCFGKAEGKEIIEIKYPHVNTKISHKIRNSLKINDKCEEFDMLPLTHKNSIEIYEG